MNQWGTGKILFDLIPVGKQVGDLYLQIFRRKRFFNIGICANSNPSIFDCKVFFAVSNITGIWLYSKFVFMILHNSKPSITGIITSDITN